MARVPTHSTMDAQQPVSRLRRLFRSVRFLMVASGTVFVLAVNGLIAYSLLLQRNAALDRVEMDVEKLALMLEDRAAHTLFGVDRLFTDIAHQLNRQLASGSTGPGPVNETLRMLRAGFPQIANILVLGPDGQILNHSGREEAASLAFADRSYFTLQRDRTDVGLYIGQPIVNQFSPDAPVVPLSRRWGKRDGTFNGVIVILIDLQVLGMRLAEHSVGTRGTVTLAAADGMILLSTPPNRIRSLVDWPEVQGDLRAGVLRNTVILTDPIDGERRIVAFRRLSEAPLVVVASASQTEALASWWRTATLHGALALAATLAIMLMTWHMTEQHTRHEQDRDRLDRLSRRVRGILDSMVDAVVTIDVHGRIETFNPAAESLFGYRREEAIGQSVRLLIPSAVRHDHGGWTPDPQTAGDPRNGGADREVMAQHRDGSFFPMTLAVSELRLGSHGAEEEERVFVGVIRDITRRKQHEAELLASRSQAEMANRAKSEFLSNMSHELRTPLNAIIGFSEILDSEFFGKLNERQKSCARDIHDSGQHLLAIVNAVLDMAKIESGRYELNEERIDPNQIIDQCLRALRDRADESGLVLTLTVPRPVPPVWVDRRAFRQVINNLLSNAVKFTPSGGQVTVSVRIEEDGGLAIAVSDTGIGIPEDFMDHLFQPFRQADTSISRRYDGTGLGLSISKNLMELHGGSLGCESTVGVGTTMTMRLPAGRIIRKDIMAA